MSCRGTWPVCSTSTPRSPRWRCTGPGRRRRRQPALPVAAYPLVLLGPPRRVRRRGGAVFSALTLVTGSLWGRPVWGVWWTWDARLTSTALLLLLELGYMALRRVPADPIPGPAFRRGRPPRGHRRAHRALLRRLVEHAAPGRVDPRSRLPAPRARQHALDLASRVRRLHAGLRVAPRGAVPDRGAPRHRGRPGARGVALRRWSEGRELVGVGGGPCRRGRR